MDFNSVMRNNLNSFRETFKGYGQYYTVIGGTACLVLMDEAGLQFRATKDIDMILLMEDGAEEFCTILRNYIASGNYTCWVKDDMPHYYRFDNPTPGYPSQIELFAKRGEFSLDSRIIPIRLTEDISSLSAIALDDDFYDFMRSGRREVDGINVLEAEYIIPFKMYAWLNNRSLRAEHRQVNTNDIKKHFKDVFTLLQLVTIGEKVTTSGNVRKAVTEFLAAIETESIPDNLLRNRTKEELINILKQIYLN